MVVVVPGAAHLKMLELVMEVRLPTVPVVGPVVINRSVLEMELVETAELVMEPMGLLFVQLEVGEAKWLMAVLHPIIQRAERQAPDRLVLFQVGR